MTRPPVKDLYDLEMESPEGRAELSAVATAGQVRHLLDMAKDRSAITGEEIARILGITPGRVSQVLNSDGNIRISTFAKFLAAMGYQVELGARDPQGRSLDSGRTRRDRRRHLDDQSSWTETTYELTWVHGSGVMRTSTSVAHPEHGELPELAHWGPAGAWSVVEQTDYLADFNDAVEAEARVAHVLG